MCSSALRESARRAAKYVPERTRNAYAERSSGTRSVGFFRTVRGKGKRERGEGDTRRERGEGILEEGEILDNDIDDSVSCIKSPRTSTFCVLLFVQSTLVSPFCVSPFVQSSLVSFCVSPFVQSILVS